MSDTTTILRAERLVDVEAGEVRSPAVLVVEGNTIVAVDSPASELRLNADSQAGFDTPFALSADARLIGIVDRSGPPRVDLYETATGKLIRHLSYDASDKLVPFRVLFSPDGKQVVGLSLRSTVVWDVETGTRQSRTDATASETDIFNSAGFRADGRILVGGVTKFWPTVLSAGDVSLIRVYSFQQLRVLVGSAEFTLDAEPEKTEDPPADKPEHQHHTEHEAHHKGKKGR